MTVLFISRCDQQCRAAPERQGWRAVVSEHRTDVSLRQRPHADVQDTGSTRTEESSQA